MSRVSLNRLSITLKVLLLVAIYSIVNGIYAQNPGGVTGTTLWLKGDAGTSTTTNGSSISSWTSQATAPIVTVTQGTTANQPTYRDGSGTIAINRFNYNPYIFLNGTNNRLSVNGDIDLGNVSANGVSCFKVVGYTSGIVALDWYHIVNGNTKLKGDGLMYINNAAGTTQQNVFNCGGQQTTQAYIQCVKGQPGAIAGNGKLNGVPGTNYTNGWNLATQNGISIGSNLDGSEYMGGGVGEFIIYPSIISATDNLKVESYLAIKYGVSLGTPTSLSDYLSSIGAQTWIGDATFQNGILGVARDDASGLMQRQSHDYLDTTRIYLGTLAATNNANTSTFSGDNEFIMMGNDMGKLNQTVAAASNVPAGICTRIERVWKVLRTNCSENFNIDVLPTSLINTLFLNPANLRLLVNTVPNMTTATVYTPTFTVAGGYITVTGITTAMIPDNSTRYISLAVINDLIVDAGPDTSICPGQFAAIFATVTGSGTLIYSWTPTTDLNNSTILQPTANPANTTQYTLSVSNGVCTKTDSMTVTIGGITSVNIAASTNPICVGDSATLTASGAITYVWANGLGNSSTITVSPAITNTYIVTGTDAGCTGTASIIVDIYPPLVISVNPLLDSVCTGSSIALTASGADVYNWTPTSSLSSSTGTIVTATPMSTTTYTVLGTDTAGCTASNTSTILTLVGPPISVNTTHSVICPGDSSRLGVSFNAQSYNWTPPMTLSNPGGQYTYAKPTATTTYTVETVNNGCTSTAEYTLLVSSAPVVNFTSDVRDGCPGLVVHFQDLSLPAGVAWYWSFGNEITAGGTSIMQNPYHQFNDIGSYDVTLTVVAPGGCSSDTTFQDCINIYPKPVAEFEAKPQRTDILDALIFFHDLSINAYAWTWYFDDNDLLANNSYLQNPTHQYSDTGTYHPSLVVFNEHGCSDSAGLTIIIDPNIAYYMPNAFSPVGINNQYFTLYGEGINISTFEMRIYNRWGEQMCYTRDLDKGWDGRNKSGKMCEQGIYTYLVQFNDVLKRYHELKGAVMLVK